MEYKDTINLPKTAFAMKAKLPEREPERLKKWADEGLAERILERRVDAPDYCLHDGPPYANGDIHIGHALNKILKDVVVRYKTMTGHRCLYVPGWDCHGLPIEQKVLQKLGSKAHRMAPIDIRRQCHDYALKWVDVQREQFKRLGIGGDWAHPYLTIDPQVERGILSAFRDLVARGLVRKGFRPVYWDMTFRTALAEAEIEYETHTSDSIYVSFPLLDAADVPGLEGLDAVSLVIWTTTPWTLPANLAVCLNPAFEYVVLASGGRHFVVARELAASFVAECALDDVREVATVRAADLERHTCVHPIFLDRTSLVVLGEHVTLEAGTGCVHTAPGHGVDDFRIGGHYDLPVFVPVDEAGRFTDDYPEMAGTKVFDANPLIIEKLRETGRLVGHGRVEHQYPYSWRSHKPIIFRATEQWFMELDEGGVRAAALDAIDRDVRWIPQWGRERIRNMVAGRPDWCLSRQRAWGVPIPSIRSKTENKSILNVALLDKVIEVVAEKGADAWFTEPLEAFWPEGFVHEPTGESRPDEFEKEHEVLDVWFDSGATSIAVCEARDGLRSPASLYLEGSDQHRGWFQSSLLVAEGVRGHAPYETVLTHGFVLDGKGEAMSKSRGNVISPQKIVQTMGADGLRLWVVSEDYRSDVRISQVTLDHVSEAYRRIRNTWRFLIGNLHDFDPKTDAVAMDELEELDRWALARLADLVESVRGHMEAFEFHRVFSLVHTFCSVQLSAQYLDVVKDRLYCSGADDRARRAAQTVCHTLLDTLVRLAAPVLVFTADEAWETAGLGEAEGLSSVHLADYPEVRPGWRDGVDEAKWARLFDLRSVASRELEAARRAKTIGHSLDASVEITPRRVEDDALVTKNVALLKTLLIVSGVRIRPSAEWDGAEEDGDWCVRVESPDGDKCERCWMKDPGVGRDATHPGLCPRCVDVVKNIV